MADYGVTESGFKRKEYPDILADMQTVALELFGPDIDLSDQSPLGLFIQLNAWEISIAWQALEDVYNSAYADTAIGQSMDYVGANIGVQRQPSLKAKGNVVFTGQPGTFVDAGLLVETADGTLRYMTLNAVTVDPTGQATAAIECTTAGLVGNVAANTITVITNPIAGITEVTNPAPTSGGQDRESDMQFRDRYAQSTAIGGASTTDAILAAVLDVPNVRTCRVYENNTMAVDAAGRPPKSVEVLVLGGDPIEIAKAILRSKAGGIQAYGQTIISVPDKSGTLQQIGFTTAVQVPIYVIVTVTKNPLYPADGDDLVKNQVISYIGGTDTNGVEWKGLGMGYDVIMSRIGPAVYQVPGVDDVVVTLGRDPNPVSPANIAIGELEVAITDPSKVVVVSG